MEILNELIDYWKVQSIHSEPTSFNSIKKVLQSKSISLPDDFIKYYQKANGMGKFHPDFDKEGFLFHPIEELETLETHYKNYYGGRYKDNIGRLKGVIIFADYMHSSWLYGLDMTDDTTYSIGIIALYGQFKVITTSLSTFIKLYLEDSEILYNYK